MRLLTYPGVRRRVGGVNNAEDTVAETTTWQLNPAEANIIRERRKLCADDELRRLLDSVAPSTLRSLHALSRTAGRGLIDTVSLIVQFIETDDIGESCRIASILKVVGAIQKGR